MSFADATLRMVLLGDDVSASAALRRVGDNASAAEKRLAVMSASMNKLGHSMTKAFTLPAVAVAVGSVKMATDFSSAMTRIQTQAGGSARDVKVLSDRVLALSSRGIQQGPVDLANSLYHLKSVGMDNAAAMKALVQASHLAAVGNSSLEDTTNALAGAWRTGIRGAGNFNHAVATLNAIVGAGNMSMQDLTEAMSTGFLPAAKTFGLSLHDVGAALAVFTDEGQPAEVAATRMRMMFSLLGAPTQKAAKLLGDVGIKTTDLAKAMRQGGLVDAIGMLKQHMQDLSKVQQGQLLSGAFGGGRSSAAIMTLINNFDVLQQKEKQVTAGMSRFGADVAKQAQTPQAQFHQLIATLETLGVEIGDKLLPMFVDWADKLNSFLGWFQALPPGVQKLASSFGILLAAMGPELIVLSKLIKAYQTLSVTMGDTEKRAATMRMGAAIGGMAALSFAAQTSNDKLKALSTIGGGALMGFAAGGPIGAAVGATAGGLAILAGHLNDAADAAKRSKPDFSGLAATFDQLTGAVTAQTRASIENQLARAGTLKTLAAYGISTRTAVGAILGEGNARKVVSAAVKSQTAAIADQRRQIALLTAANVADEKAGTLNPKAQAARKQQIDALKQQIAAEQNAANAIRTGIPAFKKQRQQVLENAAATADYSHKLKGLPPAVKTEFRQGNVLASLRSIAAVSKAYNLTPKQIKTVIAATGADFTISQVKKVESNLADVSKVRPNLSGYKASLQAQLDQAGGIARSGGAYVGYAMSSGLEAALAADRARIAAQSADLVSNAIMAARRAANAHSPSRKMIALGHDLVDGLMVGIKDRWMPLQAAMTKLQSIVQNAAQKMRADVQSRNQFAGGFSSFATSAFGADFGTDANGNAIAPTASSVLAFARQQRAQARMVKMDVRKLVKMGLSPALLRQLQAQGAAGIPTLEALAAATPSQIRQYDRLNAATYGDLHTAGMTAANRVYGSQIAHDKAVVRELHSLVHELRALHAGKGETIVVEIDGEKIIAAIKRRNKRKGVKTAGM